MRTRVATALVAVGLPLAALAGCGGDDTTTVSDPAATTSATASTSPSETPAPTTDTSTSPAPPDPACDEVWVDGATLPGGYDGCAAADGTRVKPDGRYCEFGKPLFTHDGRFWAVRGGTVHEADGPMKQDPDYQDDLASCSG